MGNAGTPGQLQTQPTQTQSQTRADRARKWVELLILFFMACFAYKQTHIAEQSLEMLEIARKSFGVMQQQTDLNRQTLVTMIKSMQQTLELFHTQFYAQIQTSVTLAAPSELSARQVRDRYDSKQIIGLEFPLVNWKSQPGKRLTMIVRNESDRVMNDSLEILITCDINGNKKEIPVPFRLSGAPGAWAQYDLNKNRSMIQFIDENYLSDPNAKYFKINVGKMAKVMIDSLKKYDIPTNPAYSAQ